MGAPPHDDLDRELPRSIRFLMRVRAGIVEADVHVRVNAAKFLIEHSPVFMRLVAEIERTKTAPVIAADAPKGYVRTAFKPPGDAVDADAT